MKKKEKDGTLTPEERKLLDKLNLDIKEENDNDYHDYLNILDKIKRGEKLTDSEKELFEKYKELFNHKKNDDISKLNELKKK